MTDYSVQTTRTKTAKKGKRPDKRPARARYWATRKLETRKVNNLVMYCGMSRQSAYKRWHKERKSRVPDGYLRRVA